MDQAPTKGFSQEYKKLYQDVHNSKQISNRNYGSASISAHLVCSICYEVFFKPRRLYCGHTFCKECLDKIFQGSSVGGSQNSGDPICPLCRQIIDKQKIGDDKIAEGVISQLQVLCLNQECQWKGLNKQFPEHYQKKCIFKNKEQNIPSWFDIFPNQVPKQQTNQPKTAFQKGSLLARIYANSPQIQQKSTFQQFKKQNTSKENSLKWKRQIQEIEKRELDQKLKKRQKDINNIMTDQIDYQTREKIRKEQSQKNRQKQLKRQKNKQQLQMLLTGQTQQQIQKKYFKEKQSMKKQMIRTNQNDKMDYLTRIFKKKQNENDDERSSYNVQQINKLNSIPDLIIPKEVPLSKVIIQQEQSQGVPSYLIKNRVYEANYEKHRLVRKPYIQPQNHGQMPRAIPHRKYTNPSQFSDNQYLKREDERLKNNVNNTKRKYTGTANFKFN